jgi:hypothetical protein
MAKRRKVNKGRNNSFINDEGECNHDWHLARYLENPWIPRGQGTFICPRCGKIKKVTGDVREEDREDRRSEEIGEKEEGGED